MSLSFNTSCQFRVNANVQFVDLLRSRAADTKLETDGVRDRLQLWLLMIIIWEGFDCRANKRVLWEMVVEQHFIVTVLKNRELKYFSNIVMVQKLCTHMPDGQIDA